MKTLPSLLFALLLSAPLPARSVAEPVGERQEVVQQSDAKPTKEARKEAKKLMKEGWRVPPGGRSIEQQIMQSHLCEMESMKTEAGMLVPRYIQGNGTSKAAVYNAAYAAARAMAQTEVATSLSAKIAAVMELQMENSWESVGANTSVTDEFHFALKSTNIAKASLRGAVTLVAMYRQLADKSYEVTVRLAYDKVQLQADLKRNLQQDLGLEGEAAAAIAGEALSDF